MGYLGSKLDDYYSYQLLDKVFDQIEKSDTGDMEKLIQSLNRINEKVMTNNNKEKCEHGDMVYLVDTNMAKCVKCEKIMTLVPSA